MKRLIYICLLLPFVAFQSCKKAQSPGDNYDFSNPLPPYAEFKTTAAVNIELDKDMVTPDTARVAFILRTAQQQNVTITYSVSGAISMANKTIIIPQNALTSANAEIPVPAKTPEGTAVVTLNKAVAADGSVLAIGKDNIASKQTVKINITQEE